MTVENLPTMCKGLDSILRTQNKQTNENIWYVQLNPYIQYFHI